MPGASLFAASPQTGGRALRICIFAFLSCAGAAALAATLRVGPGETYTRIADAARMARDGDTVEITQGEYRGDVAVWKQKRLIIRGLGAGAVLTADGRSAEGKAIWVIRDGEFDIENIEFRGARVADRNGAGIRFERGVLRVKNCRFHDNQTGILSSNDAAAELAVEDSEFSHAPNDDRLLPHLLYAGRIARLSVTGSYFHHGYRGHLLKTRARESRILYNRLDDGADGAASYELEFPNGGQAVVVGNIIAQGRATGNATLVAYGAEKPVWPDNRLYLAFNTLVDRRRSGGRFLHIWREHFPGGVGLVAVNNLLLGSGTPGVAKNGAEGDFVSHNAQIRTEQPHVSAPPGYRLPAGSPLRGQALPPEKTPAPGFAPVREFTAPRGARPLAAVQRWAPGAMQSAEK